MRLGKCVELFIFLNGWQRLVILNDVFVWIFVFFGLTFFAIQGDIRWTGCGRTFSWGSHKFCGDSGIEKIFGFIFTVFQKFFVFGVKIRVQIFQS